MKSIGFRAEKSVVWYVVLEGVDDPRKIIDEGKLAIADDEHVGKEFVLLRTQLINLLKERKPDVGGLRTSDAPQQTGSILSMFARSRVEGIVLLAAAECGLSLLAGPSATMKSGMGTKTPLKKYVSASEIRGIDLSARGRKGEQYREAVVAALAALGD
jgi:hypothetical protein